MKVFKQGNWDTKNVCPICGTQKEGKVVLIAIDDKIEGNNCEALQVHLDCLDLWWNKNNKFIYQKMKGGKKKNGRNKK